MWKTASATVLCAEVGVDTDMSFLNTKRCDVSDEAELHHSGESLNDPHSMLDLHAGEQDPLQRGPAQQRTGTQIPAATLGTLRSCHLVSKATVTAEGS